MRFLRFSPAWPLFCLLGLYPLWWAAGLGTLIFPLVAVPMAVIMLRERVAGRRLPRPPGFGLWCVFLVVVGLGLFALGADPPGTVVDSGFGRYLAPAFRIVEYTALTVVLLFAGTRTNAQLPPPRLLRLLAWLFLLTVAGGLLGVFAGRFSFPSPLELALPEHVRSRSFVQALVHPAAAQLMDVLGHESPRPAAPWGYTNTWGNNFCLLVGWFVVYNWRQAARLRTRVLAAVTLLAAVIPVVYSLNRGLWIGLGVSATYIAIRLALLGRRWALITLAAVGIALAATVAVSPLGNIVSLRLDNGKSNGVRLYLTDKAVSGVLESPIIGFGSTRTTQGGRNSIAVGESADCARCGNFTIGGNGQLWQLLFAHGLVGTAAYLGFFGYGLWRFRRDSSPIGLAGSAVIVASFCAALWYNSLVTPLAFLFLGYALLWRNHLASTGELS